MFLRGKEGAAGRTRVCQTKFCFFFVLIGVKMCLVCGRKGRVDFGSPFFPLFLYIFSLRLISVFPYPFLGFSFFLVGALMGDFFGTSL